MPWFRNVRMPRAPWHRPVAQQRAPWHVPVPERKYDWHPGDAERHDQDGSASAVLAGEFARLSEDDYLDMPGGANADGTAAGSLVGVGATMFVVLKMARNNRGDSDGRYFGVTSTTQSRAMDCRSRVVGSETGRPACDYWSQTAYNGSFEKFDPGWGPMVICGGYDGLGDKVLKISSAHVSVTDQRGSLTGATLDDFQNLLLAAIFGSDGKVKAVSISVLTVEPTTAELDQFSLKNEMAWDVWDEGDIYNHYHVANLRDTGAGWVLDPWVGQQGPMVDMVLGSAVSDANLVEWTEPEIEWAPSPKALKTGDLVMGAGIRYLESQSSRVFNGATGREIWAKATRDADADGAGASARRYYVSGYTGVGIAELDVSNVEQTFPAITMRSKSSGAQAVDLFYSGDTKTDVINAVGGGTDSTGATVGYGAGVKATGSTTATAVTVMTLFALSGRPLTSAVNSNHLVQEGLSLDRLSVGDEWLTYSLNPNVDPRLVWGMAGIDTGGALTHIYSMAYFDIDTQKVPDIIDSANVLDALDIQGVAAGIGDLIPIDENGEPDFSSFGDDYGADFEGGE